MMVKKKSFTLMNNFDWRKIFEDNINDGFIITAATTGISFALNARNLKPEKESLDTMDIIKLAGGICGEELVKDHIVQKK